MRGMLGFKKIKIEKSYVVTDDWLSKSAVGRLCEQINLCSMQYQFDQMGICVRIMKAGEVYCVLSFMNGEERDIYMLRYIDFFDWWFDEKQSSELSDLVVANRRWVCLTDGYNCM